LDALRTKIQAGKVYSEVQGETMSFLRRRRREQSNSGGNDRAMMKKNSWGAGPWQDEPDRLEWRDGSTGYICLIRRSEFGGHLCGYVGLPVGHPLVGKDLEKIDARAHEGLDYAGPCLNDLRQTLPGPAVVYWFGFYCARADDILPALTNLEDMPKLRRVAEKANPAFRGRTYRTLDYVRRRCEQLAQQLAKDSGQPLAGRTDPILLDQTEDPTII
jgi:hypothetical protein